MGVRSVEAARAEEAEGHADASADKCWEGFAVGLDGVAAQTSGSGTCRRGAEIVDPVVGLKECQTIDGCRGQLELGDEVDVVGRLVAFTGHEGRGCKSRRAAEGGGDNSGSVHICW